MAQATSTFETGVNGSDILTTDPGSATPWDVRLNAGGGNTITYDNAHAYGVLSGKFDRTASDSAATSGVVHITVTAPATAITLSNPTIDSGAFKFTYSTDPGQSYLIQSASGTVNGSGAFDWKPVLTNTPSGSSDTFSQPLTGDHFRLFRVGRLQQ